METRRLFKDGKHPLLAGEDKPKRGLKCSACRKRSRAKNSRWCRKCQKAQRAEKVNPK
jgi:hypothetical protein